MEACFLIFLLSPFIFYGIAIYLYSNKKELRTFLQMVIFPLPIVVIIGFFLYEMFQDPDLYQDAVKVVIWFSVPVGIGIIGHIIYEKDLSRFSFLTRVPAAILLIAAPFLVLEPEILEIAGPVVFGVAGALMGTYGYIKFYKGKKIGLVYGYLAILFFVVAPVVCMAISIAYFETLKDNVIYRRSSWGSESCHDIAFPIFVFQEGFIKPFLFSTGYIGIMGIVAAVRKKTLEKELREEGLIPEEFDEVLKGKEPKNG